MRARRRPYDFVKRGGDLVVAGLGLALTAPMQAAVAVAVARNLGRPVLFRQERSGRNGEPFRLVKFRTMRDVNPAAGMVSDAERMTPFGAKLRATSLDELPSLWNVLRGDMSLVGPRPLLPQYLPLYTSEQARRHEVRPGVTGYAQVSGRNALSWEERFALDVEYVERRSFLLDLRILVATIRTVVRREGIAAEGHVTMAPFIGSPRPEVGR
ncbi:sugar transferase [Georgenia thermotolerans]|uniref:Sugar transferase n=1 Tax=Georgenia thermotolerans TaxID=527326 RepID=A0A7J5US70_9MICO|nr:sugar transferase [Georgenia thermotolerans]KAE8765246.1 sugar transferase [Georgenia thermotolerans]